MRITSVFKLAEMRAADTIPHIRNGLDAAHFKELATALGLSQDKMADKLRISQGTANGKVTQKRRRFSQEVSEKLLRVARVRNTARKIFITDRAASLWLKEPAPALNGFAPIDMLDTEAGGREVESVIIGMAYGNVL